MITVPSLLVRTYPMTSYGTPWDFKLRVGNKAGVFGEFGPTLNLYSGHLPSQVKSLAVESVFPGEVRLSWLPPDIIGANLLLLRYEAESSGNPGDWVPVPNTRLYHTFFAEDPGQTRVFQVR